MKGNVLEYLEQTASHVPERIAFCDDHTILTFARLYNLARAAGSRLARILPPRGVAAVLMDGRSIDCIPAFLGAAYAGGAYAPAGSLHACRAPGAHPIANAARLHPDRTTKGARP